MKIILPVFCYAQSWLFTIVLFCFYRVTDQTVHAATDKEDGQFKELCATISWNILNQFW